LFAFVLIRQKFKALLWEHHTTGCRLGIT